MLSKKNKYVVVVSVKISNLQNVIILFSTHGNIFTNKENIKGFVYEAKG